MPSFRRFQEIPESDECRMLPLSVPAKKPPLVASRAVNQSPCRAESQVDQVAPRSREA
jgi:hypothetical protein